MVCLKASTMGVRPTRWRGPPPPPRVRPGACLWGGPGAPWVAPPPAAPVGVGCLRRVVLSRCAGGRSGPFHASRLRPPSPQIGNPCLFLGGRSAGRAPAPPSPRPSAVEHGPWGPGGGVVFLPPPAPVPFAWGHLLCGSLSRGPWGPGEVWYSSLLRPPSRFCLGHLLCFELFSIGGGRSTSAHPPPPAVLSSLRLGGQRGYGYPPPSSPRPRFTETLAFWWGAPCSARFPTPVWLVLVVPVC